MKVAIDIEPGDSSTNYGNDCGYILGAKTVPRLCSVGSVAPRPTERTEQDPESVGSVAPRPTEQALAS